MDIEISRPNGLDVILWLASHADVAYRSQAVTKKDGAERIWLDEIELAV